MFRAGRLVEALVGAGYLPADPERDAQRASVTRPHMPDAKTTLFLCLGIVAFGFVAFWAWTIVRLPSLFASPHAAWICSSVMVLSPPARMLPLAKILTKSAPSWVIHLSISIRI
jgi:hypothetical protein